MKKTKTAKQIKIPRQIRRKPILFSAYKSQIEKDFAKRIKAGLERGNFGLPLALTEQSQKDWQQFWKEYLGE